MGSASVQEHQHKRPRKGTKEEAAKSTTTNMHACMSARYMQPVKSNQISVAVKTKMSQQKRRPAEGAKKKGWQMGGRTAQLLVDNNPDALISWDFSMAG
jgi:hypothetical protein